MKLPRWTVYPALAVIGTLIVTALPHTAESSEGSEDLEGAALRARAKLVENATGGELEKLQAIAEERAGEINGAIDSENDQ